MLKIIMFLSMLMAIGFAATDANACSCKASSESQKAQVNTAKANSSTVFVGRVVEILTPKSSNSQIARQIEVVLEVSKVWKGETKTRISVFTGPDSGMCGYNFEVGKDYLVYGYGGSESGNNEVRTDSCSLTKNALGKTFKADVKYLGKPLKFKAVKGN